MAKKSSKPKQPVIGLALAGGGPLGGIYEIGAMCALEESLEGIDFTQLQHYVGVSAGGFLAAGLANGMRPRYLCEAFITNEASAFDTLNPAWFMVPAFKEFGSRIQKVPSLVKDALWHLALGQGLSLRLLERLSPILPSGIFSNDPIHHHLARIFSAHGRTNDFRQLKAQLTLVATNLNSAKAVAFGQPGFDHVPISRAVQASAALPGLFPPVQIDGSFYVDGALTKTMHASVILDQGVDLLFCLNPLVPFDATQPRYTRVMQSNAALEKRHIPSIVEGGLIAVLSQTFRAMIHSRMELGLKHYAQVYPNADIILIEPDHRDPEMYVANTFSYAQRRNLAEHAYQQTRELLRSRHLGIEEKLRKHGVSLNHEALFDMKRHLVAPLLAPTRIGRSMETLEELIRNISQFIPPK